MSIKLFDGKHLPYADNLVNLLVRSAGHHGVPESEAVRVLRPGGVAITLDSGLLPLGSFRKPWSAEIDQWTHFLHDATNNAVSEDRVVAAPRHLQWADGPLWSRSHECDSSLCAMVSANGRVFSIFDEGPTGIIDPRIPDRWTLTARDAFNGVVPAAPRFNAGGRRR